MKRWYIIKIGKYAIAFKYEEKQLDIDGEWIPWLPGIYKNIGW